MTPVEQQLVRLIRHEGPIGVDRFMALCLDHYYGTRDPFGAQGDFTTAPEISQIFGELIGLWAAHLWQVMGAPASVRLVELGPGRGTLMADMLRAARVLPAFRAAVGVHLVERSPVLKQRQGEALAAMGVTPRFHAEVQEALEGPVILIANEFLDALPVRQFMRQGGAWRERLVGLDGAGALCFGLSPLPEPALTETAAEGTVLERAEAAEEVMRAVAAHVASAGGAALFIDYGASQPGVGDTLQAVRRHAFAPVLEAPGEVDLTVQVDFGRLAAALTSSAARIEGPVTQASFLNALGLAQRVQALAAKASPEQGEGLRAGAARLTEAGPTGMGELFKVMALMHPTLPPAPGFAQEEPSP